VPVPCLWRQARDTKAGPYEGLGVKHADVVHVTVREVAALVEPAPLQLRFLELESAMDDQIVADED